MISWTHEDYAIKYAELEKQVEELKHQIEVQTATHNLCDLGHTKEIEELKAEAQRHRDLLDSLEQDIADGTFDKNNNRAEYLELIRKALSAGDSRGGKG